MTTNETHTPAAPMPPEFLSAAQSLADNLVASEPFLLFRQTHAALSADQAALDLLNCLWTTQAEFRNRQQSGRLRQSDIDALRKIQSEVQAHPVIMAYSQAQTNAVNLLKEINVEISSLLGVDFASLARRSCC